MYGALYNWGRQVEINLQKCILKLVFILTHLYNFLPESLICRLMYLTATNVGMVLHYMSSKMLKNARKPMERISFGA